MTDHIQISIKDDLPMDDAYFETHDLDWFLCDEDGHVAIFPTGGDGFIPNLVKTNYNEVEMFLDDIYSLDNISEVEFLPNSLRFITEAKKNKFFNPKLAMAGKGFYQYKVNAKRRLNNSYYQIATPRRPVHISELSSHVKKSLFIPQIKGRFFKTSKTLDKNDLSNPYWPRHNNRARNENLKEHN